MTESAHKTPAGEAAAPTEMAPLSAAQERLWFHNQLDHSGAVYVIPWCLRIHGKLDASLVSRILNSLVERHPALRTRFLQTVSGPIQIPDAYQSFSLETEFLEDEQTAYESAKAEMRKPFDLERGPPMRARLFRIANDDHLLAMPIHHICCDGISLRILHNDIVALIDEACRGSSAPAVVRSTPMILAILEHSEEMQTASEVDRDFWRKHLKGLPRKLSLPYDQIRGEQPTFEGATLKKVLSAKAANALAEFARAQRTTPFTILSAVLHVLLARASGDTDTVLGFAGAGRQTKDEQNVVGLFASLLIQRLNIDPDTTSFNDVVKMLHREIALVTRHERARFQDIVSDLGESGRLDHHPVFQTLLDYIGPNQAAKPSSCGVRITPELLDTDTARFDLEFVVRHPADAQGLELSLKYATDAFSPSTAMELLEAFETLLSNLITNADMSVGLLPLANERAKATALDLAKGPARDFDTQATLWSMLSESLTRHSDDIALVADEGALTGSEVLMKSEALALRLAQAGAKGGTIVAISAPRGLDLVVGLCGILRSSSAYIPLDTEYPKERIRLLLEDAKPVIVLTVGQTSEIGELAEEIGAINLRIDLEDTAPRFAAEKQPNPRPDDTAYVLHTSGSTGRPKGVVVSHRAIANRIFWMQETYKLTPADRVLQKTPVGFDVSVWEFFWPLAFGARLVMAAPGVHRDPERLGNILQKFGITVLHFVPTMAYAAIAGGALDCAKELRLLVLSGESASGELCHALHAKVDAQIVNLYGPTEAAVDVTAWDYRKSDLNTSVPIGYPVANTSVYILDSELKVVPTGFVGEICIGGRQVADGYLGRPELTSTRFLDDPYNQPNEQMYRTGDLGRCQANGAITFLRRMDAQIKVRGQRVEPGELEVALNMLPYVASSCVVARSAAFGGQELVAFISLFDPAGGMAEDAVFATLRRQLPSPLVPSAIEFVDRIPTLSNGKADRGLLSKMAAEIEQSEPVLTQENSRLDGSHAERQLADVWARVLGHVPKDRESSFFMMGGDSLRSIELVTQAQKAGLYLSVETVFQFPTLREMAAAAELLPQSSSEQTEVKAFSLLSKDSKQDLPKDCVDAWPISIVLAGLYHRARTDPKYRAFTTTVTVRTSFDLERITAAIATVVSRHPILRSSVIEQPMGDPLQVIHGSVQVPPPEIVDLRQLDSIEAANRVEMDRSKARGVQFDWTHPPLFRFLLHRVSENEIVLTFTEPFLDGWSATTVLSELLTILNSGSKEKSVSLPEVVQDISPRHVHAERSATQDEQSKEYWRLSLSDAPQTHLPRTALSNPCGIDFCRIDIPVSQSLSDALLSQSRALGLPIKTVLFAAHTSAISELSGQSDITSGMMFNSRPEVRGSKDAVGLFLNPLPIRTTIDSSTSWSELANAVYQSEARALAHRATPFGEILRAANLSPSSIETLFNFTHFRPYSQFGPGQNVEVTDWGATDQTYFPLTAHFRLDPRDGSVGLSLEISSPHLSPEQPKEIAAVFLAALESASRDPNQKVIDPEKANRSSVVRGPRENFCQEEPQSIFELFMKIAASKPDAVAFHTNTGVSTFSDVANDADAIAQAFADRGVGKGSRVGVSLERGPKLVATVLAALKLGAVYVPIEHTLPEERKRLIIETADLGGLVCADRSSFDLWPDVPLIMIETAIKTKPKGQDVAVPSDPSSAAYMMFTSGSTGRPKAVVVSQRAVINRLNWVWRTAPFESGETVCFKTPISFVDSFAEMFSGLLAGVQTAVIEGSVGEFGEFADKIAAHGVTRLVMVPSIMAEILRKVENIEQRLKSLRLLVLSGEVLPISLAKLIKAALPNVRLFNYYGATEICADAIACELSELTSDQNVVPLGRPIDNVHAFVLDAGGRIAPAGVVGELVVGGAAVGDCYFNDSETTAERFVQDPTAPGALAWRTNDLARIDRDGVIHFLGRADRQLKIRGVWVNPGEIEAELLSLPEISEAVVVQRPVDGKTRLVAFVEISSKATSQFSDLARHLRSTLAIKFLGASIPELFEVVGAWPRTATGKINLNGLPDPMSHRVAMPESQPTTLAEIELSKIWCAVLGCEKVGVDSDFFSIGGDSLSVIQLTNRITSVFGVQLSLTNLFDTPVLQDQALLVMDRFADKEGIHQ